MPERRTGPAANSWDAQPVVDWMLDEGRFLPDTHAFVRQLGVEMAAAGAPLWRLRLSMRTLHPLITAVTSVWERDDDAGLQLETPHGMEGRAGYLGSPLETIVRTQVPFRRRLSEGLSEAEHNVLHNLKARGATDYYGLPMRFSDGQTPTLVFVTDAADGFSEADIGHFGKIASVLAPIAEVFGARRVSLAVAEAYLGPRTGQRVLDGQITRGDIETIGAAILVSDIRDWTGLNSRLAAEAALALANRYFEVISEAVESHGGEILKFIGDGVLAIFPTGGDAPDAATVCEKGLAAARGAFELAARSEPPLDLDFGIGLHFGEVLYGNIGSKTRIDFTVLGQAVNMAARIESLCGRFGQPILFSQDFADRLAEPAELVAEEVLKGHETKSRVLKPA